MRAVEEGSGVEPGRPRLLEARLDRPEEAVRVLPALAGLLVGREPVLGKLLVVVDDAMRLCGWRKRRTGSPGNESSASSSEVGSLSTTTTSKAKSSGCFSRAMLSSRRASPSGRR
jgi:hypothetical protein